MKVSDSALADALHDLTEAITEFASFNHVLSIYSYLCKSGKT